MKGGRTWVSGKWATFWVGSENKTWVDLRVASLYDIREGVALGWVGEHLPREVFPLLAGAWGGKN